MAHVRTTIQTPVERVFDYVTTPGNRPEWHPSSLGASGATGLSLEPGEILLRRRVVAESAEALRRLKSVLEQGVA